MVCQPVSTRGCSNGRFCCYLELRMEEARFSREAQLVLCAPATCCLECPRTQLLKHFPHASHQVLLKLLSRIQLPDLSKFMLGLCSCKCAVRQKSVARIIADHLSARNPNPEGAIDGTYRDTLIYMPFYLDAGILHLLHICKGLVP
jgi:hypothetical protein